MKTETSHLHRDIKYIELFVRKLLLSGLSGNYLAALKGSGLQFEEVRPYQPGDEVRRIDWNITARTNQPYVKIFREERELQIMLAVDLSASTLFGTQQQSKRDLIVHLAALFAFLATKNNDRVGLVTFSDQIESWLPPKKGQRHVYRVVDTLLSSQPKHQATALGPMLETLTRRIRKRSVIFLISDFRDQNYERALQLLSKKHDLIPICVSDLREQQWGNLGVLPVQDLESGQQAWVDTQDPEFRNAWKKQFLAHQASTQTIFRKLRVDALQFNTGESILKPLMLFFKRRTRRRSR